MRRIILVGTVAAMMTALLMALSGAALADDVCVSHEGETIYDSGPSDCPSRPTSTAVAINHSFVFADNDGQAVAVDHSIADATIDSQAVAINESFASAINDSVAVAINDSAANAFNDSIALATNACVASAFNGEVETCP